MSSKRKNLLLLVSLFLLFSSTAYTQNINEELLVAARKGDAATVKALLAKGADVNAKFRYGATALSYVADKGHIEVAKVLLEHGADVNVKDTFYGATPIVWAAGKGHAQIVGMLLDKGADGREGALLTGVREGHIEVVKVVLEKGGLKAETLSSALASAEKNKRAEIAEMLKKVGAAPPPEANFQVDLETLKSYAGVYKNQEGIEITFSVKDGKLTATPPGQPPLVLGALDKTTFKPAALEGVTAIFNIEGGKVIGFTLKQQGTNDQVFKKSGQ